MGLKQQPKCKDKTCQFCTGKYCTILKQKPDVCRFYKAKSRYIDADKLQETVYKRVNSPAIRGWLNLLINEQPTADVKEVKHGEWITDEDGFVICSECGEEHTWDDFRPSFCDMCGARMDDGRLKNDKL